jgi:hypothetical protein
MELCTLCKTSIVFCHKLGVWAWLTKRGFGFEDLIDWTFIQLVTTIHKSVSSTGDSQLLTTLHQSTTLSLLLEPESLLHILGSDLAENTSIAYQWMSTVVSYCYRFYLAKGCLPRICLHGKVFIEPLLNNGDMRHNIMYVYVWRYYSFLLVFQFLIIYLKFVTTKLANLYCSERVV